MNRKDLPPHAQAAINRILEKEPKQPSRPKAKPHGEFDSGLEARFGEYLIGLKAERKGQFDFEHHPKPLILNGGANEYEPDFRVGWIDWAVKDADGKTILDPEGGAYSVRREVLIDTKGYNGREISRFKLKTAAWQYQDKEIYVVENQGRGWTYLHIVPGVKVIQWKRGAKTIAPWER